MMANNLSKWKLLIALSIGTFSPSSIGVFSQEPLEVPFPQDVPSAEQVAANALPQQIGSDDDYETLTRGPLHEAFAEPIVSDPGPGLIVPQAPPPPIDELPPEYRPDGEDAVWISGYWGWDEERSDFIWISGVYRVPPQGHQWVPGYWNQVNDGWQWVQGFWIEDMAESIDYMPPPPTTLENGPSSPSPGADYFYIPGNWTQSSSVSSSYVWNAGYWHPMQNDFVWIPAHFVWTPRGCVFINGYWDQRLPMRGFCFAPIFIQRATYSQPGWCYRPSVVLNSQVVLHNLFIQPRYNHYLFGDYYGIPSNNRNVLPAYVYHQSRGSCDPLISFYSAYNARQGHDLIGWYGKQYADFSRNPSHRPPQVWSPKLQQAEQVVGSGKDHSNMAHRLDQLNALAIGPRVSPIATGDRPDIMKRDFEMKNLGRVREESERNTKKPDAVTKNDIIPKTLSLPKFEQKFRRPEDSSRVGKVPEPPRRIGRDRLNADALKSQDRLPRDNNLGQDVRRMDPLLKNTEPKRGDSTLRNEVNPLTKPLDNDLSRQSETLRNTLPKDMNSFVPSTPSNVISPPIVGERNRDNGPSKLPNIDLRKPNIDTSRLNIPQQNHNMEPRKLNIPSPQFNRQSISNENQSRLNRGPGPIEKSQNNLRNIAPVQPVVPRVQEPPKVPSNNSSNSQRVGRGNSERGENGRKPN